MSYGYNQYLYGNSSYRNPSIVNKNEEKQNLNQSSQFNIAGKMAIATTPLNYHYIHRRGTPSQSTIQKSNTIDSPKQNNNISETVNKNFLNNYYNPNNNKTINNQYNSNAETINRPLQSYNPPIYSNPVTQRELPFNSRQNKNEELNRLTDQFEKMLISKTQNQPQSPYSNMTQNPITKPQNQNPLQNQSNPLNQRTLSPYNPPSNPLTQTLTSFPQTQQQQANPLTQTIPSYQTQIQPQKSPITQSLSPYQSPVKNTSNYYNNSPQKQLYQNSYFNPQSQTPNIYPVKTPYNQNTKNQNTWSQKVNNQYNPINQQQQKIEPQTTISKYSSFTKGGVSIEGRNKTNQDSSIAKTHTSTEYTFGVFDGHGPDGHYVSQSIKQYFDAQPNTNLSSKENLFQTFSSLSKFIQNQKNFDVFNSGSTCVLVHITLNKIYCANCGDSRAILISGISNNIIQLSHDHKPELPEEKKRIEQSGGRVDRVYGMGPYRVWMKNDNYPGLAMSRSIGDGIAHNIGVSDIPEVLEFDVEKIKPMALVVASDGVWEFMSNDDVKGEIMKFLYSGDCDGCARSICEKARGIWERNGVYCDDITAVVAFFKN